MTAIFSMIAGVLLLLAFGLIVTRLQVLAAIYDVRISNDAVNFILFSKLVFYRLRFTNIEKVVIGHGGGHFFTAVDFRNRFFGGCFLILKKNGIFTRKVLVSPADPDFFIQSLSNADVPVEGKLAV